MGRDSEPGQIHAAMDSPGAVAASSEGAPVGIIKIGEGNDRFRIGS
jgi:hypothetical protein